MSGPMSGYDQPDVNRLLKTLRHQQADRIPHLEFWVTSQTVFEYVLEKKLDYAIVDAALGGQSITPEDHVEFSRRLGMDAVVCNFNWRPNNILAYGPLDEIEERVRVYCERLGPGGGYVLGSSTSIMEGIPPANFVAMTQAVHKYGRYGSLGREA